MFSIYNILFITLFLDFFANERYSDLGKYDGKDKLKNGFKGGKNQEETLIWRTTDFYTMKNISACV